MSLSDHYVLPNLYEGLASPPLSPVQLGRRPSYSPVVRLGTPLHSPPASPLLLSDPLPHMAEPANGAHPSPIRIAIDLPVSNGIGPDKPHHGSVEAPAGSLLPTQHAHLPKLPNRFFSVPAPLHVNNHVDSLTRERKGKMPVLSHLLSVGGGRVLSLAADERYVYAGCQSADDEIVVFSRNSLQPLFRLLGHGGSVLALLIVAERNWLVSSSSAGDVRIWDTRTLEPVYTIFPCDNTGGDIYSLAWDEREGGTLYFGTQGATIEWVHFGTDGPKSPRKPAVSAPASVTIAIAPTDGSRSPPVPTTPNQRSGRYRPHHFFDNPPDDASSGSNTPKHPGPSRTESSSHVLTQKQIEKMRISGPPKSKQVEEIEVNVEDRMAFAHFGYVYALTLVPRADGDMWLVSGSGDGDVKVWRVEPGGGLTHLKSFEGLAGAVLSFAVRDSLLFAGIQDGETAVWDLETGACIRTIEAHDADVMTITVLGDDVYTAAADGKVLRVNSEFDCTAAFKAHSGTIITSLIVKGVRDGYELITAGDDSYIKIWNIDVSRSKGPPDEVAVEGEGDVMLYALSKLIAVPTVSDEPHRESCRQGAHLLKKILSQLGAQATVLSGAQGRNPLVMATFSGTDTGKPRKRLLFYGHYDVQPASEDDWESDPWELSGRNGYLYGRGVSDNKGPIMAVACAASTLRQRRELDVDLVLLIEGEEEAGSFGFAQIVRQHKEEIGHIDAVLLSNSTWIGEDDPCIVFGMRGVVYANLSVTSQGEDAHSGVDGGAVAEPMLDIVRVLGNLAEKGQVKIPGFYDNVRPETDSEIALLNEVAKASDRSVAELEKVWRQPSFSIASITSSGASNKTVIPKRVSADVSMRIVPDQDLKTIVESLKQYCRKTFEELESPNQFDITVTHSASWWLTLNSPYLEALEDAVKDVWNVKPLKIREGGTVPTIFWLEQEFGAPCVHLPLGQASDAGHLANERMRLLNLRNGKRVVESFLTRVSRI